MASHQHKHLCPNNLPWQAKAFDPSQGQATITHLQSSSRMMPPSLPFSCTFSSSFTLLPASSTITSSLACISSPSTYPPTATNSLSTSSCLGTSFFQPSYGAACSPSNTNDGIQINGHPFPTSPHSLSLGSSDEG